MEFEEDYDQEPPWIPPSLETRPLAMEYDEDYVQTPPWMPPFPLENQQLPTLSQDEWSHINSYLFHDAFDSARHLVNMSRVSRAWREVVDWNAWSIAFGFFPLQQQQFPAVLAPIMECARIGRGAVTRVSAMEHLKISTTNMPHTTGSGRGNAKHLYKIEDLFRAATEKYSTIDKLEKTLARCQKAAATREKNRLMKEERRLRVDALFHIKADHLNAKFLFPDDEATTYTDNEGEPPWDGEGIMNRTQLQHQVSAFLLDLSDDCWNYLINDEEINAYIHKGEGSWNEIRETALAWKREREEESFANWTPYWMDST